MKVPYLVKPASLDFSQVFTSQVLKPQITIVLKYGEKKQKLFALIDSGADACLFPKGIADILGVKIKEGQRIDFSGIGGTKTPFYFHEVDILFGEYQVKSKVGFSTQENIGVSGILGQQGFFEHFIVSYHHKDRYVEIKKSDFIQGLFSKIPFSNNIFI
ncbi:MAG: hypothetical protein A3J52_03605 [Omnitrophica bacterium RIFCSPHIGHO2_02_FULL_49_9]|nr:MAG: hypothetical protein A3J52_03605 [Omnitrophica bacterium RIFCSPHIGHO2_02_FULL_49_9]